MKQMSKRLTYANVMSSIAVFLVLGGATAFAANQLATQNFSIVGDVHDRVAARLAKITNGPILDLGGGNGTWSGMCGKLVKDVTEEAREPAVDEDALTKDLRNLKTGVKATSDVPSISQVSPSSDHGGAESLGAHPARRVNS